MEERFPGCFKLDSAPDSRFARAALSPRVRQPRCQWPEAELAFLAFGHVLLLDRHRRDLGRTPRGARGAGGRRLVPRELVAALHLLAPRQQGVVVSAGQWRLLAATQVMRTGMRLRCSAALGGTCVWRLLISSVVGPCHTAIPTPSTWHMLQCSRHLDHDCSRADWLLLLVTQLPRCTGMYSHSRDAGHSDL